ncbi:MAG: cobalamin-dependent protein [Pseudomonadota bacterium]
MTRDPSTPLIQAPDPSWPSGDELLAEGAADATNWQIGASPFLECVGLPDEASYKRACAASGTITQHAQVGFRDPSRTRDACAAIFAQCEARGVIVDRYGFCLDWSMAVPRADRAHAQKGTGLILSDEADFVAIASAAPVAPHFGDFVLGFPAALENTQAALSAGATAIGNLGQYFTFRTPGFEDDVAATTATLKAIGLIVAQPVDVLIHSNLDDGFAAQFSDLVSCLGAALLEKHVVETLCGGTLSHCFGHHFTDPVRRLAFQRALARVSDAPGTMIYGSTMSYRGTTAENYAGLASYLMTDIISQRTSPSGHAINPVPVMENDRIPDIDEIVDAQCFAHRLREEAEVFAPLIDTRCTDAMVDTLVIEGRRFAERAIAGLASAGIDINDPCQMLITLRRLGGYALEETFADRTPNAERRTFVQASLIDELDGFANVARSRVSDADVASLKAGGLTILTASTDVHCHGKMALDRFLQACGTRVIDGGMTADPEAIAATAAEVNVSAIAISTYNGVALAFAERLQAALAENLATAAIPVFIGGRLNQIPATSNTGLPVDVSDDLATSGVQICRRFEDIVPPLLKLATPATGAKNP